MKSNPELHHILQLFPKIQQFEHAEQLNVRRSLLKSTFSTLSSFVVSSGPHKSVTTDEEDQHLTATTLSLLSLQRPSKNHHVKPGNLIVPVLPYSLRRHERQHNYTDSLCQNKVTDLNPATGKMVGSVITSYSRSLCSIIIAQDPTSEKQDPLHSQNQALLTDFILSLYIKEVCVRLINLMKAYHGWSAAGQALTAKLLCISEDGGGRKEKKKR